MRIRGLSCNVEHFLPTRICTFFSGILMMSRQALLLPTIIHLAVEHPNIAKWPGKWPSCASLASPLPLHVAAATILLPVQAALASERPEQGPELAAKTKYTTKQVAWLTAPT
jgi:hypothetical protein